MLQLQRQFITDQEGKLVGVILPIEEYRLVENLLRKKSVPSPSHEDKLHLLKQAVTDPLFLDDLEETMADFAEVDSEWWEPNP